MAPQCSRVDVLGNVELFNKQQALPEGSDLASPSAGQLVQWCSVPADMTLIRREAAIRETNEGAFSCAAAAQQTDVFTHLDPETEWMETARAGHLLQLENTVQRIFPSCRPTFSIGA